MAKVGSPFQAIKYADHLRQSVKPRCDQEVMAARFVAWWCGDQKSGWNGFYEFCQENKDQPIPMRLICEGCGKLHIDKGEFATKPHHTHSCQSCGLTWRPAIENTVGVQFLPGFKDDH